jgi:aryl-alcohol dehydrogenase-like predicted oxidoreductase
MPEAAPTPLPGRATADATAAHARRFGVTPRQLGRTRLMVAPVGFGGYRVHIDSPVHRQALDEALRAGVNLVDTSANYTDGGSERMIGAGLSALAGVVPREAVVVVSKVGYMQGEALAHGRRRGYPDVVEYQPECWHCIHPEYLADQLAVSRERLGLATVDVLLLHNPEYFFIDRRNRRGRVDAADRDSFYARVRAAFAFLEQAVARGEIAWYGVSSNGFAYADDAADRTDLARMLALAREVGGEAHHFAVAQLPRNLYELGAHAPGAPGDPLAVAAAHDVGVLVNRPLNAFIADPPRTIRLADVTGPQDQPRDPTPLLREVQRREDAWQHDLGRRAADQLVTADKDPALRDQLLHHTFRWGHELGRGLAAIRDLQHWLHVRNGVIATHMGQVSNTLLTELTGATLEAFRAWWEDYSGALLAALDGVEDGHRARAQATNEAIGDRLAPALPETWHELPLSQRAVLALLAAPPPAAVSAVLVGMRRPAYVHDMTAIAAAHPQPGDPGGLVDPARLMAAFAAR